MKTITIASLILFQVFNILAQPTFDVIKTNKGDLMISPVQHATFVMTWNGKTIYVDPTGGADSFTKFKAPDFIFITDIHGDHFDVKTLEALNTSAATIIVPQAVADLTPSSLKSNLLIVGNLQRVKTKGLTVTAVPMYNLPETSDSRHPRGRGNGYVIKLGNKKVYISGDTEDIVEMRKLKGIDAAFVCMNLPYTMDINQAASAVLDFKPEIVYPYHYRGQNGLSDVGKFKELVNGDNFKVDVKLLKWY